MRSAILIILLFSCKQGANENTESTVSTTDSAAAALPSDTLVTEPNIEISDIKIAEDSTAAYSVEKVRTFDSTTDDIYPWITFMEEGPSIERVETETVEFFRLVITVSEIYNGIYFEKCSQGFEGGGRRIMWKRLVDADQLTDKFSLRGEFAGVRPIGWRGWNSFVLNIHGNKYIFENLEDSLVTVKREK